MTRAQAQPSTGKYELRRHVNRPPSRQRPTLYDAAVFRGLSTPVTADLIDRLSLVHFPAGQLIFGVGDPGDRLYLIVEGKVKIGSLAGDGREYLSAIVGPREMFGAVSILDGAPRESNATAITPVVAAAVDRDTMSRWLRRHPEAATQLLRLVSRQVRSITARFAERFSDNVPARVAEQLHLLAQQFGVREGGAIRLNHDLTQEEIGQLVGACREHVNLALGEFSRRGWIRLRGKSMLIFGLPQSADALGLHYCATPDGEPISNER